MCNGLTLMKLKVLVQAGDAQARVVDRQLLVLAQTLLQGPQCMLDQFISRAVGELVEIALEIGAGHLGSGTDAAGKHLLGDARGLELKEVRALGIDAGDEKADAVGALAVVLGVCLGAVAETLGDFGEQDGTVVGQARGKGLLFHEVGEDAGIRGETGEGDAIVAVDGYYLLLVRG